MHKCNFVNQIDIENKKPYKSYFEFSDLIRLISNIMNIHFTYKLQLYNFLY